MPEQDSEPARSVVLEDALAVGGGYVELVSPEGIELAGVALRLLDLKRGLVAPLRLTAFHLSRGHAAGCCPACRGEGRVPVPDVAFLVRDKRRSPTAETFLRPEALAILKGVRRSVMTPFFRRLEAEGIWNSKTPFYRLSDEACRILLFGYWCRPGPGSFLKSPRADARKVASWLRWDGLFAHVLEQLERSTDAAWAESLRQSLESRPCGLCDGSGLGPASRLVSRDGVTLHEWVTRGTVGELRKALRGSTCESKRERRLRDRVVRGLGGVAKRLPEAPLSESLEDVRLVRAGLRAVVPTFLQLPIID